MSARWTAAALVLVSCGQAPAPPGGAGLPEGVAGDVGGSPIATSLVAALAGSRGSPRAALDALVEDALLARGAAAEGLERSPDVRWSEVTALARQVPLRLRDEANAEGPATVDELATVEVQHAVILRTPNLPRETALASAQTLLSAVATARGDAEFEAAASAVVKTPAHLLVQRLPPFDVSGQTPSGGTFDATFVTAAVALRRPGEMTGIVETPFGWHVIRLVNRTVVAPSELDDARARLGSAVTAARIRRRLTGILEARRARTSVEVSAAADALMVLPGDR